MVLRRLILIFCLTFTMLLSVKIYPAHAFPFGRIAQEIMSFYTHNSSKKSQTRNKPSKQPEVNLPPGTLSRAIIHTGRNSRCDREKPRSEIKPSFEDKCRLEASKAPE